MASIPLNNLKEVISINNAIERMESKLPSYTPWESTLEQAPGHKIKIKLKCTLISKRKETFAKINELEVSDMTGTLPSPTDGLIHFQTVKLGLPRISNLGLCDLEADKYIIQLLDKIRPWLFTGDLNELDELDGDFRRFKSALVSVPVEVITTRVVTNPIKRLLGKQPEVEVFNTYFHLTPTLKDLSTRTDRLYRRKEELVNFIRACLKDNTTLYENIEGFSSLPEIQAELKELFQIYNQLLNQNESVVDNNNHTLS
jgi:hypothetical protein